MENIIIFKKVDNFNLFYNKIGKKIWCQNPKINNEQESEEPPYILCEIKNINIDQKNIEVKEIENKIQFSKTIPYINDENININDMASDIDMSEIDILNNISNRFLKNKKTFTNVGSTLLIVNPYKKNDEIYSNEKIENYINLHKINPPEIRKKCEEPHLYDLILIAIENLLKTG